MHSQVKQRGEKRFPSVPFTSSGDPYRTEGAPNPNNLQLTPPPQTDWSQFLSGPPPPDRDERNRKLFESSAGNLHFLLSLSLFL